MKTLNNSLPHVVENIVPCCRRCNTVRLDQFTFEEMKLIGAFIRDSIDNHRLPPPAGNATAIGQAMRPRP